MLPGKGAKSAKRAKEPIRIFSETIIAYLWKRIPTRIPTYRCVLAGERGR